MARALRIDGPGSWHHVMNRGGDHQQVFFNDRDRLELEGLFGDACSQRNVELHAYCFMGTHFHTLMHCPDGGLSATMQQVMSSYTRIVNHHENRDGALFRGRFHSVPVTADRQVVATAAYIHRNPIEFVPPAALGAYRWSSYGVYLGRRTAPPWLHLDHVSAQLSVADHRAIVERPIPVTPESSATSWMRIDRALTSYPGLDATVVRAASLILGADVIGASASELAGRLGLSNAGAARTALSRARTRITTDETVRRLVDELALEVSM